MSLLGGGSTGRKPARGSFQGAVAGADNVKPKSNFQRQPINVAGLRRIQSQKKTNLENYKLNSNGKSRFRLLMPFGDGNDGMPLVGASRHWLPFVNEDGKDIKRPFYCYEQFGLPCPICTLRSLLLNAHDESLKADADTLRPNNLWAAYIINRDYMIGMDDPNEADTFRQDKVLLFNAMSTKIADAIISYMEMKVWGDATDPDTGYDFEVEGKPTGKSFNGYKVSDYTITPYPRDYSPAYSTSLLNGLRPLSEVVSYSKPEDLRKVMDPILVSLAESSEEGMDLIDAFKPEYERMLLQINAGPNNQIPDDAQEVIEAYDVEDPSDETVGEENDKSTANAQSWGESDSAQPDNTTVGGKEDVPSESGSQDTDEFGEVSPEGLDATNPDSASWEKTPFVDTPPKEKPVMPPKPQGSTLIGKLQGIRK